MAELLVDDGEMLTYHVKVTFCSVCLSQCTGMLFSSLIPEAKHLLSHRLFRQSFNIAHEQRMPNTLMM